MHVYRAATYTALSFDVVSFITQRLAGPVLDSKYAKTIADVDALLKRQPIGVQLATDGWKRKNVNEAQKVQNFIANFPDGGSSFLTAHGTDGCTMDNHEYERILTEQIVALGERLGSINKVLGCITDREAAIQLAFDRLETKYHWLVNLVCQVSLGWCRHAAMSVGCSKRVQCRLMASVCSSKTCSRSSYQWATLSRPPSRLATLRATMLGFAGCCMSSRKQCMATTLRLLHR